jgi:hypothetical protein
MALRNDHGNTVTGPSSMSREVCFNERDILIDDVCNDLPLLLKILRGRDGMLREIEDWAMARGWNGGQNLVSWLEKR